MDEELREVVASLRYAAESIRMSIAVDPRALDRLADRLEALAERYVADE